MDLISQNLVSLRAEIAQILAVCGRSGDSLRLIAVSKKQSTGAIRAAQAAGQMDFGENYVQELCAKCAEWPSPTLRWHFIGHLQTNKARHVVGRVHLIHTLDRVSLAQKIETLAASLALVQDCLIEVKLSRDAGKSGCAETDLPKLLQNLTQLPHVRVRGLMTMGSLTKDSEIIRTEFRRLHSWREHINDQGLYPEKLTELSMGMSGDFALAIAEGATLIRVGTRIFGTRA